MIPSRKTAQILMTYINMIMLVIRVILSNQPYVVNHIKS